MIAVKLAWTLIFVFDEGHQYFRNEGASLKLRALRYFLGVCELGSIGGAARRLDMAQSTVSGAVSGLEEEFGTALFRPSTLGMRSTEAGGRLHRFAAPLLLDLELACLDLYVGRINRRARVPITLAGIPIGSLVYSAVTRGAVLQARQTSGIGVGLHEHAADDAYGSRQSGGILIHYGLLGCDVKPDQEETCAIRDQWIVLSLREPDETALSSSPLKPKDLLQLRLLVPTFGDQFSDALAECVPGLRPLSVPFDEAGAPFTLLSRRDASLLLPAGCLPAGFRHPGLIVRLVEPGIPDPVIFIGGTDAAGQSAKHLKKAVSGEIRSALSNWSYDWSDIEALPPPTPDWFWLRHGIDFHTLSCFAAAVDAGSITRAAELCHVVQPALSTQIKKLEKAVARTLLRRTPRGVRPTPAGRRFYEQIQPLLQDATSILEQMKEPAQPERPIRIGLIPALNEDSLIANVMERTIVAWQSRHADIPLSVSEAYSGVLRRWLRNQLIEIALVDNRDEEAGLALNVVTTESMMLVHAPGQDGVPDSGPIRAVHVLRTPLALPSRRFGLRALAERSFAARGLELTPRLEVDSLPTILRLVRTGPWTTILPASAILQQINSGQLVANEIVEPTIERHLVIARRAGEPLSSHARELVRILVDRIANPVATL